MIANWACLAVLLVQPGEPWKRNTIDASSRGADGVRLADINGDGLLDIVTGWELRGTIQCSPRGSGKNSR